MLLDVPTGVVCRDGPDVPAGATVMVDASDVTDALPQRVGGYALVFKGDENRETIKEIVDKVAPRVILLKPESQTAVTFVGRRFMSNLIAMESQVPVMLWFRYPKVAEESEDDVVIKASADFGSLFVDGYGDGVLWDAEGLDTRESSFNLLQACRMRISKTEFISCPSCGRTLFDLQTTTARIQERTGHLPGVRIAVMGCIVNGPGEMADADFGYVGSVPGKVDLYVNYDVVKKGIPSDEAVDALVDLIKENDRWQDPPSDDDEEADDKE
jgi:(E)-4-hydroxy-3-methylbut-2-enyl-diphosphate synthase